MQIDPRTRAEIDEERAAARPPGGVRRPRFAGAGEGLGAWWYRWGWWLLVVGGLVLFVLAALVLIEVSRSGWLPWQGSVTPTTVATSPPAGTVAPTPVATTTGMATAPAVVTTAAPSPPPPATVTAVPPTPTLRPASATPVPATPTAAATFDPMAKQGMGEGLREIKEAGAPGLDAGDGGRGDALKARFLEAMQVWDVDIENGDGSKIDEYFTGELLERAQRRLERVRSQPPGHITQTLRIEHRVMDFISGDGSRYLITDAQTRTAMQVKRGADGRLSEVVSQEAPTRACNTWTLVPTDDKYKISREAGLSGSAARACLPEYR